MEAGFVVMTRNKAAAFPVEEPIVCMFSMPGHTSRICWLYPFTVREFFKRCLFIKTKLNRQFYIEVIRGLREDVWRKFPVKWHTQDWLLHHKSAPAYMVFVYSTAFNWEQHGGGPPPSSLRLTHVPKDENPVKGKKFKNTTDNEGESQTVLERIMTGVIEMLSAVREVLAASTRVQYQSVTKVSITLLYHPSPNTFGSHLVCEMSVCCKVPYGAAFLRFSSVLGVKPCLHFH